MAKKEKTVFRYVAKGVKKFGAYCYALRKASSGEKVTIYKNGKVILEFKEYVPYAVKDGKGNERMINNQPVYAMDRIDFSTISDGRTGLESCCSYEIRFEKDDDAYQTAVKKEIKRVLDATSNIDHTACYTDDEYSEMVNPNAARAMREKEEIEEKLETLSETVKTKDQTIEQLEKQLRDLKNRGIGNR